MLLLEFLQLLKPPLPRVVRPLLRRVPSEAQLLQLLDLACIEVSTAPLLSGATLIIHPLPQPPRASLGDVAVAMLLLELLQLLEPRLPRALRHHVPSEAQLLQLLDLACIEVPTPPFLSGDTL